MRQDQYKAGKELRKKISRKSQADFKRPGKRDTVLNMIKASNYDRIPELIPIRHFRMSQSPFAFYRGTASLMAYDLFHQPHTEQPVQAIGDCHLMNFGGFATPERAMVIDANDFDETHPAPWEWDVKRLATSFVLAARNKNLAEDDAKNIATALTTSYRQNMFEFADMNMLDLWYMKFDLKLLRAKARNNALKTLIDEALKKANQQTQQKVFYKITTNVLGSFEITDQPPLIYHPIDVKKEHAMIAIFMEKYIETLQPDRRWLISNYKVVDVALKVVGVGSVGTRCMVVLLMNSKDEPLFLQVKEARQSVLEKYTRPSAYAHHGQRVVEGQRLVQAASDIFLGWSTGPNGRAFYFRQLRDRKIAPDIDLLNKQNLAAYAETCGRMLARAHAKTGNPSLLCGYMGNSDSFDTAVTDFSIAYADQTEKDYEDFMKAIKAGKLPIAKE